MAVRWFHSAFLVPALGLAGGCSDSGTGAQDGDFVSDNPFGGGGDGNGDDGGQTGGEAGDDDDDDGGDPEREIAEADIVHIEGDRLYALSQYGGLAVIDVSEPDDLRIMGRYRAHASPFEMYVDGDQVFVMYSQFGRYHFDEAAGGYVWQSSSRLLALDASDPADIVATGELDMPGRIQDSRRVGDVLYLVTHEDGWCWECQADINTAVTSFDVSDPSDVTLVDQLRFVTDTDEGWSGERSVSATNERLYVAGREWDGDWENGHSVIDVVDITDAGGVLREGAHVAVAGQIENRWQMDEFDGVLRVVSQPGQWGSTEPPVIETFAIASSEDIAPLGSTAMQLPRPESLRAVRFDGDRGYAITFEQTDPLFTLDLSDPGAPQQVGELEIPGWVTHMEPRGDRILGLGFDPSHPDGALNVSLFDVSTFEQPTMLSRVHFGGDWANFAEDQDRLHKAFTILEDLELILVPFSGWEWDEGSDDECGGGYRSGIQLVDWAQDALTLRGEAPSRGAARRALVHRERLLAMSDKAVATYDIGNRDAPVQTHEVALAKNVTRVGIGDDIVARLSRDWWTEDTWLEVVDVANPDAADPIGALNLVSVLEGTSPEGCWHWGLYDSELVVHGQYAYLLREQWDFENYEGATVVLDTFDLTDPAAPAHVGSQVLEVQLGWSYGGVVATPEDRVVEAGDALVLSSGQSYWSEDEEDTGRFFVIDLSDPAAPQLAVPVDRPGALAHGAMQVLGETVVSWHVEAVDGDTSKVRWFLDRLDVGTPAEPRLLPAVNVPGMVVGYDQDSRRAVTVDFAREEVQVSDADECYEQPKFDDYDYDAERCFVAHRRLQLVRIDAGLASVLATADLEGDELRLAAVTTTEDRVFARLSPGFHAAEVWPEGSGMSNIPLDHVAVLGPWDGNELEVASVEEIGLGGWWGGAIQASGTHAALHTDGGLAILDATDAAAPSLAVHDLVGYGCWDLQLSGGLAMCPMGDYGLQTIPLGN